MPLFEVQTPEGKKFRVEAPEGATQEDAIRYIQQQQQPQQQPQRRARSPFDVGATTQKEGTAGFFEAIKGGTKNILSSSQTAAEAPFISGEEAATRGLERQEGRTERPGFSLDEITKTYKEDGLFSAAGETLSQIPGAVGEQLPFLGAMFAGAKAGRIAGPYGMLAGSLLAPFLVASGSAMERKASEQVKKGDKVDINELGAYGTGLASAALERIGTGLSGLSKIMGINFLKDAGAETAEQIARRGIAATLAKGGVKLVRAEVPTEIGQQALERYYAGLSLTDKEAQKEYAEAAAGATILAPLGMAGSAYQRKQATSIVRQKEEAIQKALARDKQAKEADIKAREEAQKLSVEEAAQERRNLEQIQKQKKEIVESHLKQARESEIPIRTLQELIDDLTNLGQTNPKTGLPLRKNRPLSKKELEQKKADFKAALAAPSGFIVPGLREDIDPETGQPTFIERELTAAEAMNIPIEEAPARGPIVDGRKPVTKEMFTDKKEGFGIGHTAKVIKETEGLDPLNAEDNVKIRTAIEAHLQKNGVEDDAPSSIKLRNYLENELPTLEQLENERYAANFFDPSAGTGNEVLGEPLGRADAALLNVSEPGPVPEIPDDLRRDYADALDSDLALEERRALEDKLAEEEIVRQELALAQNSAKKEVTKAKSLQNTLNKIGINRDDILDITGETKPSKAGYGPGFRVGAPSLIDTIEDGRLNEFLPPELRIDYVEGAPPMDASAAYEYITDLIRSDTRNVKPYELNAQLALIDVQLGEATGTIVDINGESIPQALIDAYKSRKSDSSNYYQELEKYTGADFKDKTLSDIENLLEEYVKSQPQDIRYVVFGKVKGTNVETVWQEQVGSRQRAEDIARNLEQQGKATNTRIQEYDLKLGPMGIPQSKAQPAATPKQEQSREEYLRELNFYLNNRIDGGIYAPYAESVFQMYERLGMPQTEMSLKGAPKTAQQAAELKKGAQDDVQESRDDTQLADIESRLAQAEFEVQSYLNQEPNRKIPSYIANRVRALRKEKADYLATQESRADTEGTGQVYYRGTSEKFDDVGGTGGVIYLSPNRAEAEQVGGSIVTPYRLKVKNTFDINNKAHLKKVLAELSNEKSTFFKGRSYKNSQREIFKQALEDNPNLDFAPYEIIEEFAEEIEGAGFDSFFVQEQTGFATGAKNIGVFNASLLEPTQESRADTEGTGQTTETVTAELVQEFGPNVSAAVKKGTLVIVDNVSQLPSTVQLSPTANGAFDKASGVSYLIANRIQKGRARRVLLHEIGEHYGLEGMLGKDYTRTLNRLKTLKDTDKTIGRIWESVTRLYPDLEVGSTPFLQEVMAKVGEDAPKNSLFRRVVGLVKEFLRKLGLVNVDKLTTADLQDMVLHSLRTSLAQTTQSAARGTAAVQMSKEELKTIAGWSKTRQNMFFNSPAFDNENAWDNTFGMHFVTMMSPQQFLDLATPISTKELDAKIDRSFNTEKGKSGLKDKLLKWDSELSRKSAAAGLGSQPFLSIRDSKIVGHEGRHRARALQRLGIKQFPVVLTAKGSIFDTNNIDLSFDSLEVTPEVGVGKTTIGRMVGISKNNRPELEAMVSPSVNPDMSQDIQFSVPDGYESTGIFAPPSSATSKNLFEKFVDTFESFKNNPTGSLGDIYVKGRITLASSISGVEEKLGESWQQAIQQANNEKVRADVVLNQALASNVMATEAAERGRVDILPNGLGKVIDDENNINRLLEIRNEIASSSSPEVARHVVQAYLIARRYELELKLIEDKKRTSVNLRERLSKLKKEAKSQKGGDLKETEKIIRRYEKALARAINYVETRYVSPDQEAAIAPALAEVNRHPQLKELDSVLEGVNINRINMMEKSGIYSKDQADEYRAMGAAYVPLFRDMNDLEAVHGTAAKQFFNGFADVGKEYGFSGSDKVVDDVVGNLLRQNFFAVNAALRNNANRVTAEALGRRDKEGEGEVIYYERIPEGNEGYTSVPVFIDGERFFVDYGDPDIAIAIQGALPVYTGMIEAFGKAAKYFRLGITANPVFQAYQVGNDAIGAALYSGVREPFALSKRIVEGFAKDLAGDTAAIDRQMRELGIAGGFGNTAAELQLSASRKLGVENSTKVQNLLEKADSFASKSDLAQRRGIFEQTLIETGGTVQADGSIIGGNEVLAMNRALNIINWQKRGASSGVRILSHTVPFLNAYLQGMDVLINAFRGKGLSGEQAAMARQLLFRNLLNLSILNMLYSLIVSGSDEYEEQDDRIKFRNYIIPGTGFKMPVRAELSLITKFIPEQTALAIQQYGKEGAVDMQKISDATKIAISDAAFSPNLFPQLIRGGIEATTNYNFYTDRPLVGTGLSRLATEEQYTEGTSEFSKFIAPLMGVSPIKADHVLKAYTGTAGATVLFTIDRVVNTFADDKRAAATLKDFPPLAPLIQTPQGRDAINDFYDLKEQSDEVAATLNRLIKFRPEKVNEYRKDNQKMIATRKRLNSLNKSIESLRDTRKQILSSNISADAKRARIVQLDKQTNNVARNITKLRLASGL
jgi:hypothetical protein